MRRGCVLKDSALVPTARRVITTASTHCCRGCRTPPHGARGARAGASFVIFCRFDAKSVISCEVRSYTTGPSLCAHDQHMIL